MSQAPRHVRRLRRATRPWGLPDLQQSAQSNAETRDDDCDTVVPAACTGLCQWPFIGAVRREEHDAAEAMPGDARLSTRSSTIICNVWGRNDSVPANARW